MNEENKYYNLLKEYMISIIYGIFIYEKSNVAINTHADDLERKLFIVHICFKNIVGVKHFQFFFLLEKKCKLTWSTFMILSILYFIMFCKDIYKF